MQIISCDSNNNPIKRVLIEIKLKMGEGPAVVVFHGVAKQLGNHLPETQVPEIQ